MRKFTDAIPFTDVPVAYGNFDKRPDMRKRIDIIVMHSMAGYMAGTRAIFGRYNPADPSSAHYGISMTGALDWYVDEDLVAYHATNYDINQRSIGIEHEDLALPDSPRSDALYETSAILVADICRYHKIPCDRRHIIKHNEVPVEADLKKTVPTRCPTALDVDRIVKRAQELLGQNIGGTTTPSPVPQPSPVSNPSGYTVNESQWRAANVLTDALDKPEITTVDGRRYGNEEGMARDFVASWADYIQLNIQTKQTRSFLEKLSKLFGIGN